MKKNSQLGQNASTAAHRLRMDVLFMFVKQAGHVCFRCGGELARETFSIDHKVDWLDSADPVGLFFDLENIAFSHKACNYASARKPGKGIRKHGTTRSYDLGCRCEVCKGHKASKNARRVRGKAKDFDIGQGGS